MLKIPLLNLEDVAEILDWVFLVLPNYSLGQAFNNLYTNDRALENCKNPFIEFSCKFGPELNLPPNPCCKGFYQTWFFFFFRFYATAASAVVVLTAIVTAVVFFCFSFLFHFRSTKLALRCSNHKTPSVDKTKVDFDHLRIYIYIYSTYADVIDLARVVYHQLDILFSSRSNSFDLQRKKKRERERRWP